MLSVIVFVCDVDMFLFIDYVLLQRGNTPLSSATCYGRANVIKFLLSNGAKGDRRKIVSIRIIILLNT